MELWSPKRQFPMAFENIRTTSCHSHTTLWWSNTGSATCVRGPGIRRQRDGSRLDLMMCYVLLNLKFLSGPAGRTFSKLLTQCGILSSPFFRSLSLGTSAVTNFQTGSISLPYNPTVSTLSIFQLCLSPPSSPLYMSPNKLDIPLLFGPVVTFPHDPSCLPAYRSALLTRHHPYAGRRPSRYVNLKVRFNYAFSCVLVSKTAQRTVNIQDNNSVMAIVSRIYAYWAMVL
jgi:hypothetical protein